MRRVLIVDIDPEREEKVLIGPMKTHEHLPMQPEPILDTAILCEAVSTMIKLCDEAGIKQKKDSLADCIEQLKKGFIDEGQKGRMAFEQKKAKAGEQGRSAVAWMKAQAKKIDPAVDKSYTVADYARVIADALVPYFEQKKNEDTSANSSVG